MDAYLAGLEKAKAAGLDLSQIHSVASFFVSRVDTEIDKRLDEASAPTRPRPSRARPRSPTPGWPTRRTRRSSPRDRWAALEKAGANKQRPLWASTGVKDPAYQDTLYVDELVAPGHGQHHAGGHPGGHRRPRRDHRRHRRAAPTSRPAPTSTRSPRSGISYDDVVQLLEDEGVEKFEAAWNDLLDSTEAELKRLAPSEG